MIKHAICKEKQIILLVLTFSYEFFLIVDGLYSNQLWAVPVWTWSVSRALLPQAILLPTVGKNHRRAPRWSQDQIYQRIRVWICFCVCNTCMEPWAVRGRYNAGAADGAEMKTESTCELLSNFNQFQSGAKVLSARLHLASNSTDRLSTFPWETDG